MKSSLFLMEQLIAILIFAICASVCVSIFTISYEMSQEGRDVNNALIIAQNGAECYKAAFGDTEMTARFLEGDCSEDGVLVYYDKDRRVCEEFSSVYVLTIMCRKEAEAKDLLVGKVSVDKNRGDQILSFTIAARRKQE